nr:unnamed protein product [Spirometra erinaceieuropaei]
MDLLIAACANFDLAINMEKTVVIHQPPPDAAYIASQINMNGAQLQAVDNFTYLGSTSSRTTKIDKEVTRRISKTSQTFGRPRSPPQHQSEDIQSSHPADVAVRSGDQDGLQESGAETQSSPPSTDTEAEVAKPDPEH